MRRRIFAGLLLCSILVTLATGALTALIYYDFYIGEIRSNLQTETALVTQGLSDAADLPERSAQFAKQLPAGMRLTLVSSTGTVLYDSEEDIGSLDNHLDREEVQEAMRSGWGEAFRHSATLKADAYYYAVRMSDGTVLRLSSPLNSVLAVFEKTLPYLILIAVLMIAISLALSSRLARRALAPVDQAARKLDSLLSDSPGELEPEYEELIPFTRKIVTLDREIREYIQSIQNKQATISAIIENMREGLILLDKDNRIITLSRRAISLLSANPALNYAGHNLLELVRSQSLLEAIKDAAENGMGTAFREKRGQRYYSYFISPAQEQGVIIFIVDSTNEVKAETMRRDFASNVSHELKTPVTSIMGFTELLENGMIQPEDVQETYSIIRREARHLLSLIDDILRLSQIENADSSLELQAVDVKETAERAAASLQPVAGRKNVTLQLELEPVSLQGQSTMIYELIFNLIDNAIKYNVDGGSVSVRLWKEPAWAVLSVADTGIGIPQQYQDRIFERFYRVDQSRSKATGGTGLGLSIVKHAVEYHKGTITLESTEGAGTSVLVRLPR